MNCSTPGLPVHHQLKLSHEIKRRLLLRRKVMTNLDSRLKSRDITLVTKVHLVKSMVFQVVMYECESWTAKKAECQRVDVFELWWWRGVPWTARRSNQSILKEISPDYLLEELMLKLMLQYLRVPWTARRSNQSILKEISPEYSLEGLMLKLQYFGHLMQRTDSLEKTLTMTS